MTNINYVQILNFFIKLIDMNKVFIAPMLDYTDKYYRFFIRKITKKCTLFTEMIVADSIIHADHHPLLSYNEIEHPIVVQIAGSDPHKLGIASKICQLYGYDSINLNVGCPSDRVKSGNFGACLMLDTNLVTDCIKSMLDSTKLPISIKHRIGIDYNEEYGFLRDFVGNIAQVGCKQFIIHARNAILKGLTPKQNREIPKLKYDYVYKLKEDFPDLDIIINGGIKTINDIASHLKLLNGVMIGREAYNNPFMLNDIDHIYYSEPISKNNRFDIAFSMIDYLHEQKKLNIKLYKITKHMAGLFLGCHNARLWRFAVTNKIAKTDSIQTYLDALNIMNDISIN